MEFKHVSDDSGSRGCLHPKTASARVQQPKRDGQHDTSDAVDKPIRSFLESEQRRPCTVMGAGSGKPGGSSLGDLTPVTSPWPALPSSDKTFCVHVAENEEVIRKHAELSGSPARRITRVESILDPTSESDV